VKEVFWKSAFEFLEIEEGPILGYRLATQLHQTVTDATVKDKQ